MAQYTVKHNQNIFDISIELYGSIEGIFDLLISNPKLSMASQLKKGDILECHPSDFILNDGIVQQLKQQNMFVQNGCRHVYYKNVQEQLRVLLFLPPEYEYTTFCLSGDGTLLIDWGDNSDIEPVILDSKEKNISHYFNNTILKEREIRFYGDFNIKTWKQVDINTLIEPITPIIVDEFYAPDFHQSLVGLYLFQGTIVVNMQGAHISDLSPILHMSLQELDLTGATYDSVKILDQYLCNLVSNYQNRRNCVVKLTTEPGVEGMEAINTIINEPSWNESGAWKFIINDKIYTYNG